MRAQRPAFALIVLSIAALASAATAKDCYGVLQRPLVAGGFTDNSSDCEGTNDIKYAGEVSVGELRYKIYSLLYTVPHAGGFSSGGQRILVFRYHDNRLVYRGSYHLDSLVDHKVWVKGSRVYIDASAKHGNNIQFTKDGPPVQAFLDQYIAGFDEAGF